MSKIKILHDDDGEYGFPVGTELTIEELFDDFRYSNECTEDLYNYLCRIPIPAAVEEIAKLWRFDYEFV